MPDGSPDPKRLSSRLLRERRTQLRFPARLFARCRLGGGRTGVEWPATVHDVSQRGIGLALPRPFSPGCVLSLKLHQEEGPILLSAQARVIFVRHEDGTWLHGCEFSQRLDDPTLERLLG